MTNDEIDSYEARIRNIRDFTESALCWVFRMASNSNYQLLAIDSMMIQLIAASRGIELVLTDLTKQKKLLLDRKET